MKTIQMQDFRPEMTFPSPVFLDDGGFILTTPAVKVEKSLIKSLRDWGFNSLFTEGDVMGRVLGTDGNAGILQSAIIDQDVKTQQLRSEAKKFYSEALHFTHNIFEGFKKDNHIDLNQLSDFIRRTIDFLKIKKKFLLRFGDFNEVDTKKSYDYHVTHAVKSTFLSLALGMDSIATDGKKIPPHKLIELGISAILHEVGMFRIPPELYDKQGTLSPKEKQLITAHPILGFRMLKTFTFHQDVLLGVLQHHERNDGTGYPQKLKESQISIFAKIISIACSYTAQVSSRPFRTAKDGHRTMIDFIKTSAFQYDRNILETLTGLLSIYPLGCYVVLNNGCTGVVVETNDDTPKYPVVKLFLDKTQAILADQMLVKTSEYDELHIARVLEDDEKASLKGLGLLVI